MRLSSRLRAFTYGYNGNHQVTSVSVNGTTVLNGVTYEPLGPVNGWAWGNDTTAICTHDTDGKIAAAVSAGTKTYSYDNAFRITGIADTSPGAANWTYGYDALDRITSGTSPFITRGTTPTVTASPKQAPPPPPTPSPREPPDHRHYRRPRPLVFV